VEKPTTGAGEVAGQLDHALALAGQGSDLARQLLALGHEGCTLASQTFLHGLGHIRGQSAIDQCAAATLHDEVLNSLGGHRSSPDFGPEIEG
jgi:hypothetical protein